MIDYDLLIVAVFGLLFFVIIGGTILLFPLSRKLGHLIEARTSEKKDGQAEAEAVIHQLSSRLGAIEEQLGLLAERQEFLDHLVAERKSPEALERGDGR